LFVLAILAHVQEVLSTSPSRSIPPLRGRPNSSARQFRGARRIVTISHVGGVHHRYERRAA
jgi:hypothetical protein